MLDDLYTIAEVAVLMECNPMTVRRAIKAGDLPGAIATKSKAGKVREWLIPGTDLLRWRPGMHYRRRKTKERKNRV